LLGRTPFGRGQVKLEWEVKPLGELFDGKDTGPSASWQDTGTAGVELSELVDGLARDTAYHWRVRLRYHPAGTPFQQASRWLTMPWNGWEEQDLSTSLFITETRVITYTYDGLYRLTGAEYSSGESFLYDYDKVGKRTSMTVTITSTAVTTYTYDAANRLTHVNGVAQTWDARGNLLEDFAGTEYTYDVGNQLVKAVQGGVTYESAYNALGDRLQQTVAGEVTTYTLDLFGGLTQVLWDGENLYLYGLGRIGEEQPSGWAYHLADALGSVRRLADKAGWVTMVQSYRPYGEVLESKGVGATAYAFAGEWLDAYIKLIDLRSRYYAPETGRF
jgi:YD repeat-containing protein